MDSYETSQSYQIQRDKAKGAVNSFDWINILKNCDIKDMMYWLLLIDRFFR